ncbi:MULTISPECIES: hypothetical protein [Cyanophyceae]|uniref:Uncharacterized protein n=1 Tax=Nodularia spumigena CENA596 TaxID=1819295 RepID=A0A166JTS1_NODSP|nr:MULTISPECIES: hypothetical protein [Cyanophyceae]KZL50117.1 hypothetical protein A2T98_09195 [Nodularia spumigena CENA596]MDB9317008.1 hypothetical protein [Nodularia spumigena CS-590/01A]MDB9324219.1 hypothetical protein [Nodularia spumigena CS-591/07A]MDB9325173.1 hypothetical protein [Nodularia spumigena CS-590/02]MDB9329477.1 hypothetical protein [Nodularia spumigena CS-591/04]
MLTTSLATDTSAAIVQQKKPDSYLNLTFLYAQGITQKTQSVGSDVAPGDGQSRLHRQNPETQCRNAPYYFW